MINWLRKHIKKVGIIFFSVCLTIPWIVWFLYYIGHTGEGLKTDITADGLLGYFIAIIAAIPTLLISVIAIEQSDQANDISSRLLAIEECRVKLEMRPFVLVTEWSTYERSIAEITSDETNVYVQVGSSSDNHLACLSLTITNTTQQYVSVSYKDGTLHDATGDKQWKVGSFLKNKETLYLLAGESGRIVLYAEDSFFEKTKFKFITLELHLENRFGEHYIESFDAMIIDYSDAFERGMSDWHVTVLTQNFKIHEAKPAP
jgi:hypothetical protein